MKIKYIPQDAVPFLLGQAIDKGLHENMEITALIADSSYFRGYSNANRKGGFLINGIHMKGFPSEEQENIIELAEDFYNLGLHNGTPGHPLKCEERDLPFLEEITTALLDTKKPKGGRIYILRNPAAKC